MWSAFCSCGWSQKSLCSLVPHRILILFWPPPCPSCMGCTERWILIAFSLSLWSVPHTSGWCGPGHVTHFCQWHEGKSVGGASGKGFLASSWVEIHKICPSASANWQIWLWCLGIWSPYYDPERSGIGPGQRQRVPENKETERSWFPSDAFELLDVQTLTCYQECW